MGLASLDVGFAFPAQNSRQESGGQWGKSSLDERSRRDSRTLGIDTGFPNCMQAQFTTVDERQRAPSEQGKHLPVFPVPHGQASQTDNRRQQLRRPANAETSGFPARR
jgi:hypothetical protein